VETTIHVDGSCDRMIWQPKDKFLPDQALKPEWNARWKSVSDAPVRSGASAPKVCDDVQKYFIAGGSFSNPREIPPHYRYADEDVCFEPAGNGVFPVFELAKLEREVLHEKATQALCRG
jgi:hypothetical protein